MKKILLLMASIACISIIACSEKKDDGMTFVPPPTTTPDDDDTEYPEYDPDNIPEFDITIYYTAPYDGTEYNYPKDEYPTECLILPIYKNQLYSWPEGGDSFIVDHDRISEKVYARHVGTTTLQMRCMDLFNQIVGRAIYHVTVLPPRMEFEMPITEFGQTKEYIIAHETRQLAENRDSELIFEDEHTGIDNVTYYFDEDSKLCKIVILILTSGDIKYVDKHLRLFYTHFATNYYVDADKYEDMSIIVFYDRYKDIYDPDETITFMPYSAYRDGLI